MYKTVVNTLFEVAKNFLRIRALITSTNPTHSLYLALALLATGIALLLLPLNLILIVPVVILFKNGLFGAGTELPDLIGSFWMSAPLAKIEFE